MKLNNKGFVLTSTYLAILSSKKNNIDKITEDLEEDYFTSNSSNG